MPSPVCLKTTPSCTSTTDLMVWSCAANAAAIAASSRCQRSVEPSMSVNMNVTVPVGNRRDTAGVSRSSSVPANSSDSSSRNADVGSIPISSRNVVRNRWNQRSASVTRPFAASARINNATGRSRYGWSAACASSNTTASPARPVSMSTSPRSSMATARNSSSRVAATVAHGSSANSSNAGPLHSINASVSNVRRSTGPAVRARSHNATNRDASNSSGGSTSRYPASVVCTRSPSTLRNRDTAVRTTEPSTGPSARYSAIRSADTLAPSETVNSAASRRSCGVNPSTSPSSSHTSSRPRMPSFTSAPVPMNQP